MREAITGLGCKGIKLHIGECTTADFVSGPVFALAEMAGGGQPPAEVMGSTMADPAIEAELLALRAAVAGKQLQSGER